LKTKRNIQTSSKLSNPLDYGYVIVIASFLIIMASVGMFLSVGVFFKPLLNDFGWTRAVTSAPLAISVLVTGFAAVVAGRLADRFGPRIVVTACGILTGSGYLLMSNLHSLWQLYLYFGLFIGAGAAVTVPLLSTVPKWFVKRRTAMTGLIAAGGGVGGLIMPLLASWLISIYSWQRTYFVMGIIFLVIVLTAAQFLKKSPEEAGGGQATKTSKPVDIHKKVENRWLQSMLRTPQFWLMIILFFAFGFVVTTISVHIVNHATDLHISPTAGAGILSIANGLSVVGSIIFGVIGDRLGNKRLFVYTFFVLAASLFSLLFLGELWMLNIFAVVFGLAFGSGLAQAPALVARFFGTATLGVIFGIISFCQTLGASLGSYLAGLIYDISQDYQLIFIICGVLCLIGMTATALLKPLKNA
jgi:MFS family permease